MAAQRVLKCYTLDGNHRLVGRHCYVCGRTFAKKLKPSHPHKLTADENLTVREELARRDGAVCFYCGHELVIVKGPAFERAKWRATIDHKKPRSRGGTNARDNLVLACTGCNGAKGDRTLEEWAALGFPKRRALAKDGDAPPVERMAA